MITIRIKIKKTYQNISNLMYLKSTIYSPQLADLMGL